jgi:hypothetical protein
MTSPTQLAPLSVADLIRAGDFATAVERMQRLVRLGDPTEPVDMDAIRARFEATRAYLRAVTPPRPFRVVVEFVRCER